LVPVRAEMPTRSKTKTICCCAQTRLASARFSQRPPKTIATAQRATAAARGAGRSLSRRACQDRTQIQAAKGRTLDTALTRTAEA
jgi:hypothetical protein